MNSLTKFFLSAVAAASLAACGGGGSGSAAGGGGGGAPGTLQGTAPSPTAAPTAIFTASQTVANELSAEVKAGLANAATASKGMAGLPIGVETSSLPTGVVTDISKEMCSSGTASVDSTGTVPAAGFTASFTFGKCVSSASPVPFTLDGAFSLSYTRYVSPMDAAFVANFTKFSVDTAGQAISYTGGFSCDYKAGATSYAQACYYSDGSRAWGGSVTYTASAGATGSYTANYNNGVVKVVYNKFGSAGGTATITGANGYSAVVTYTSATSYSVDITVNGVKTTYTSAV